MRQFDLHKDLARELFAAVLVCTIILASGCGIQIKQASLYDGQETSPPPAKPAKISMVVEPVIFDDSGADLWVTDDPNCTTGGVTDEVTYSGSTALKINWNRDPAMCEWAGFGIGWDSYAGKDLTEVYDYAAIQMYVRSQEGKMFGLPVVLTLEDYSGKMAWSYTSNKYFERYYIDEEWQKVVVPLNTFDLDEDGIDAGNIKSLNFELQQAGGIYLDDIELVYYEPQPVTPWMEEPERDDPLAFPIQLFDDAFINNNGWGIHSDHCQEIELTSSTKTEGSHSIHATWDMSKEDCYMVAIGVSWSNWYRVDMSAVAASTWIEFDLRAADGPLPNVKVGFEDYERALSFATISEQYFLGSLEDRWKQVRIPLSDVTGGANWADIKQLQFRMEGAGEVYLDNIRLTRDSQ